MTQTAQGTTYQSQADPVHQRDLTDSEKLSLMDQVINSVSQGLVGQVGDLSDGRNQSTQFQTQSQNQQNQQEPDLLQYTSRASKESESTSNQEAEIVDSGGVQSVEHERTPEIPVEVESFLHRVEDHQESAPQEVVIADGTVETIKASYPSKPVIVLPFTQEEESIGAKKPLTSSFRWLVEFGRKITKMFFGKVIYKD
jgi:hypothetical protein